jgi:hypothetical protein
VVAIRVDDGYVVSLPYGSDRDWVKNVLAAGSCGLERGGRHLELTQPSVLRGGDGMVLVPALMRAGLRALRVTEFLRLSL